jgi:outer membrane protein assembly factor BamD (BamD/ComL family)
LAAEVAALDAARGALDADAPDDALALLHRYLLGFPKGKLAPEAEVLAIEAYAKKGDRLLLTREATRFLDRYPKAPQRTRVEQLCAEASPRRSPP